MYIEKPPLYESSAPSRGMIRYPAISIFCISLGLPMRGAKGKTNRSINPKYRLPMVFFDKQNIDSDDVIVAFIFISLILS